MRVSDGDLATDEIYGFEINQKGYRFLPYKNQFWNSITYELSQSLLEQTRTVYGIFDFLGDIGGLSTSFMLLFRILISIM